ncbi:MAG: methyltransferase, partial [Planctomycetia bacterium]|nr:methyltransferase [Planctomycetia bacterium]
MKTGKWTQEEVLALAGGYQQACVLTAAAEFDLFTLLDGEELDADGVAERLGTDACATAVMLDALVAMGLLAKDDGHYAPAPGVGELLGEGGAARAMVRHQAGCLKRWAGLARVVESGHPPEGLEGIFSNAESLAAFIEAMHDISEPVAPGLIEELGPPEFRHLLDVGGASGTWTIAFLQAAPKARATLFDLPDVILMAERRIADAGLSDRVTLVAGDYNTDALPPDADLVWLSAIVHQNSREQNRDLFAKIRDALVVGGRALIRDIVMDESRTHPPGGALFA